MHGLTGLAAARGVGGFEMWSRNFTRGMEKATTSSIEGTHGLRPVRDKKVFSRKKLQLSKIEDEIEREGCERPQYQEQRTVHLCSCSKRLLFAGIRKSIMIRDFSIGIAIALRMHGKVCIERHYYFEK